MATQASNPGSGFFYRPPVGNGTPNVPPTPPEGNGRRFTGKQLLLAFLGGSVAIGYLTMCDSSKSKPITHFTHPVRVMGTGVSIRTEPMPDARTIASVSSTDSVENIGRINDQWSQVRMHDGRTGFISNQYLEGVSYVPLAAAALARPYTSSTPYTTRRSSRLLRSRRGRSTLYYSSPAPAAAPSRPSKAPTYTYTTKVPTYTARYSTARSSPSHTYPAPRVNYTFSSSRRSSRRRR